MYVLPTAPRPIGGVLDDAIRLYRASFARVWMLALVSGVLTAVLGVLQATELRAVNFRSVTTAGLLALAQRMQTMERSPALWLSYLVVIAVFLVMRAAIIARQHAVATQSDGSLGTALVLALRRLPEMIVAGIVWGVGLGIFTMLLIVPGIWLAGRWQLWLVALITEDVGPMTALKRSYEVTRRNWWRTTTTNFVALVIVVVLSGGAGFGAAILFAASRGDIAIFTLTTQLLSALVGIFTMPLMTVVMLSIYYDDKLRREGGDLDDRLRRLG